MAFLHAAESKLEYRTTGTAPERAPTLVWLHEALGCAAMWKDLPVELSARTGFGSLNYSRQGHGRSESMTHNRDVGYLHHEAWVVLPQVLHIIGVHDTVLVGHSDGATIALLYASQRPDGLLGMVLEAPHVFVEDITLEGIRKTRAAFANKAQLDRLRRYHGENTDAVLSAWHDTWLRPDFRNWNIEDVLHGIQCPTLIIQGEDDEYGSMRQITTIADKVSGPVRTLIVPGCGHIPHASHKAEASEAMVSFVSEICAPSGRN